MRIVSYAMLGLSGGFMTAYALTNIQTLFNDAVYLVGLAIYARLFIITPDN
jgi:hypothetical protein